MVFHAAPAAAQEISAEMRDAVRQADTILPANVLLMLMKHHVKANSFSSHGMTQTLDLLRPMSQPSSSQQFLNLFSMMTLLHWLSTMFQSALQKK